jgi:hypothetical protein
MPAPVLDGRPGIAPALAGETGRRLRDVRVCEEAMLRLTIGKSKRLQTECRCLYCGHGPLDGYFMLSDDAGGARRDAEDGDLTICGSCAALQVFVIGADGAVSFRAAAQEDIRRFRVAPDVWRAIQVSRKAIRLRRRPRR